MAITPYSNTQVFSIYWYLAKTDATMVVTATKVIVVATVEVAVATAIYGDCLQVVAVKIELIIQGPLDWLAICVCVSVKV
jgi:hypothetical protein